MSTDATGQLLDAIPGLLGAAPMPDEAKEQPEEKQEEQQETSGPAEAASEEDALLAALQDEGKEDEKEDIQGHEAPEKPLDLTPLAEKLGIPVEDIFLQDGALRIRTKIDGELGDVSMADLRKGYQKDSSLTRRQQKQEQALEQERQAIQQEKDQIASQAQIVTQLAQQEFAELQRSAQSPELAELRTNDPAEYAARVAEMQQKGQHIQAKWQSAQQALQQQQQNQQAKQMEWLRNVAVQEHNKLRGALGWDSDEVAEQGGRAIREYLVSSGYSDQELERFIDSRAAVIADKARRYDELVARSAKAKEKVKKVSEERVSAPGAQPKTGARTNMATLAKKARASGRVDSKEGLAYILEAFSKQR